MSRTYMARRRYIESIRELCSAREDFKDLQYHIDNQTKEEVLTLTNVVGYTWWFNITGYSDAQIFHAMAQVECGQKPKCLIEDKAKLMELGKKFNQ